MHRMLTWKTLNGKNHGSPQTPTLTMQGEYNRGTQRQRPRAHNVRLAAVTVETHFVSLSLSLNICRKSLKMSKSIFLQSFSKLRNKRHTLSYFLRGQHIQLRSWTWRRLSTTFLRLNSWMQYMENCFGRLDATHLLYDKSLDSFCWGLFATLMYHDMEKLLTLIHVIAHLFIYHMNNRFHRT